MRKFILFLTLIILPRIVCADMLHILDSGGATSYYSPGPEALEENKDIRVDSLNNPGRGCEFGFAFKESGEKFQWQVNVVVENNPGKAGHNHREPLPELFYYPNWPSKKIVARLDGKIIQSPVLDQSQRFVVHLATVNYATELIARGVYTRNFHGKILNPTLTHTLRIRTPDLEMLPRNDRLYKSTGGTVIHPENHYGTANMIAALKDLAAIWKNTSTTLPLLEIGNISLPWGGAFDTNADWKADMSHAFGIAADIGKRNLNSEDRTALIKLMCGSGFYVYNLNEDGKEQYHIVNEEEFTRLKTLKWPLSLPNKSNAAVMDCCAAKIGTQEYSKCTGFSEAVKR